MNRGSVHELRRDNSGGVHEYPYNLYETDPHLTGHIYDVCQEAVKLASCVLKECGTKVYRSFNVLLLKHMQHAARNNKAAENIDRGEHNPEESHQRKAAVFGEKCHQSADDNHG